MNFAKLGEVASWVGGVSFKPDDKVEPFDSGSIVCFRTKNVQEELDQDDLIAVPERFVKRDDQIINEGDILVSTANSWNLVGKCTWIPKLKYRATLGGFISLLRANIDMVDPRYLYLWFNSPEIQHKLRHFGRQTTNISNLDKKRALKLDIPLPPLAEQKRIAAILDKADELRRNRRRALQRLDDLLQSVFLEMFGDPVTNPKNWGLASLGEVLNFTTGKLDSNAAEKGGQYPFFTCAREVSQIDSFAFDTEALLLAGNNASADYWVKHYKGKFNAYQRTYVLTSIQPNVSYRYLRIALEMKLADLKRWSRGTNTRYLTLSILKPIPIQIPTVNIMGKFDDIYNKIDNIRNTYYQKTELMNELFSSLQQKAFRGEL